MKQSRRSREKLIFLMTAGATGIILLVMGGYQLIEFTDSTAFCGRLCHDVMYPEYTTHQASPHSRVSCSECHVGSGADYLVRSKVSGTPMLFHTIAGTYHRPIPTPVENLRPARETCEQCHRPARFAGDIVRVHTTYESDETNTENVDTRALRVGGGELEVARDIHWHIAARVWYMPLDRERQDIAWVGVEDTGGQLTEYIDPQKQAELTAGLIDVERRLMDCMDCHNRATHIFNSPEDLVDAALTQGKIDRVLPYIKREALEALEPPSQSLAEANARAEDIKEFYRTNYTTIYNEKVTAIEQAVAEVKEIARLTTFPHMKVSWETYIDNSGHLESPGCFRCHGKLVELVDNKAEGEVINADCDLCHYFELE